MSNADAKNRSEKSTKDAAKEAVDDAAARAEEAVDAVRDKLAGAIHKDR